MSLQCLTHNAAHVCRHVKSRQIHRHNNHSLPLGPSPSETGRGGMAQRSVNFRFWWTFDDFQLLTFRSNMLPAIWNGKSSYFHLYVAVLKELNFGCGAFLWMMCHYPNELVSGSFQRNAPVNFFLCNLSPAFTLKNKTPRIAPYLISWTVFWCSEARLSLDSATRA